MIEADAKEWADEESGGNASAGPSRPRPTRTYGDDDDQPAKRARTSVSYPGLDVKLINRHRGQQQMEM
jgi:hypothetical protein